MPRPHFPIRGPAYGRRPKRRIDITLTAEPLPMRGLQLPYHAMLDEPTGEL